jgi:hypothetical protein
VPPPTRCDAKLLNDLERLLSLESLDHPTECTGQPAYILVEREILGSSLEAWTIVRWTEGHVAVKLAEVERNAER